MRRNQMSSETKHNVGWEIRQLLAIFGIIVTGIVAALMLPVWMAAICLLFCLCALRVISMSRETVIEPVVIRRDERRS